jgi:hypothetical protein
VSLLRPARGCSCEGSAKEELPRKASTPWAEVGSKGVGWNEDCWVGWKLEGGSGVEGSAGALDDEVCDDDLRPVRASQMDDMVAEDGGQLNGGY